MESDEDDGNEIADEITLADVKNLPEDPDVPNGYKTKMVHSLRADQLVQKGLNISNMESEVIFYNSKFLYKGKTLLKKAKKLSEGEFVDILVEKSDVDQPTNTVTVRRVKVIKVFQQTTKKGKPKVAIRVWLKPFEVKR
ncbi:uncharacterized protein LOC128236976 isoform X2 [Mya arenaria]|nr:uncharacterized protein LOC128236976 isoform X2 [Mya arenaria]